MAKIDVSVKEVTLLDEDDIEIESVQATCSRCLHTTESYGTLDASRRRCLVLMREECPMHQSNFYVDEEQGADS